MNTQQRIEKAKEILININEEDSGILIKVIIQLINICDNQQQEINALMVVEKNRLLQLATWNNNSDVS